MTRPTGGATDVADERGGALTGFLSLVGVVLVACSILFFMFGRVVPPNYIGIRHNGFSLFGVLEKGYAETGLRPGLHWRIPGGVSDIILLPNTFQLINFDTERKGGDLDLHALDVPTSDGSKVKTDITLIVRLFDEPGESRVPSAGAGDLRQAAEAEGGEKREEDKPSIGSDSVPLMQYKTVSHGGPQELVSTFTAFPERQRQLFSRIAEDYLRQYLGKLSTTEYYDPVAREGAALRAHNAIQAAVKSDGIELWATLIRRYVYAEREIDDQIFAKNLQE
ncbi:MAG: hypothetical protein KDD44_12485, partial [Bdellovibrionales bacterium]|nr:hypothetical protein [Bdellovibrionales bacterium]